MPQNLALKISEKKISQVLLFTEFILEIDREILRWILSVFRVRLRQKNGFCVLVDVPEMAKNR